MNTGRYIFSQVTDFIPRYEFDKCVARHFGDYHTRSFTCYNQFLYLLFGQLTTCQSMRDVCLCLEAHRNSLYHLGISVSVDSTSLTRANDKRDYRIYEDFGRHLINMVRPMYAMEPVPDVNLPDYELLALDSTTISCSIKLLAWALGKYSRGAVKMHTLMSLRGSIPVDIHITHGKWHDSNMLDVMDVNPNDLFVMDKAYVDFEALYRIHKAGAFFVTRAKENMKYEVLETLDGFDPDTGVRGDYLIRVTGNKSKRLYPEPMRMVVYYDTENDRELTFITNNTEIAAIDVANLYRNRWQIEVFFKWMKQNLTIKKLWGHSQNAVMTQLWVSICAYLLIALIKAQLKSPYTITEVATLLSVSALEKISIQELLTYPRPSLIQSQNVKELTLFDIS